MSFSFTIYAPDRKSAKAAVSAKLAEVLSTQPAHAADKDLAEVAAHNYIDLLPYEPEDGKEFTVHVNGSVGWTGTWGVDQRVTGVSLGVSAYWSIKPVPKTPA